MLNLPTNKSEMNVGYDYMWMMEALLGGIRQLLRLELEAMHQRLNRVEASQAKIRKLATSR